MHVIKIPAWMIVSDMRNDTSALGFTSTLTYYDMFQITTHSSFLVVQNINTLIRKYRAMEYLLLSTLTISLIQKILFYSLETIVAALVNDSFHWFFYSFHCFIIWRYLILILILGFLNERLQRLLLYGFFLHLHLGPNLLDFEKLDGNNCKYQTHNGIVYHDLNHPHMYF